MHREETVSEDCKHEDCVYRVALSGSHVEICDYIGMTGHPRGCNISECDKYRPGRVKVQIGSDMKMYRRVEDENV